MEVRLEKNGEIRIIDSDEEAQFVKEFMAFHCPTPATPYLNPYQYCKSCYYCNTFRGGYMECRIYTMMKDGKIYG